MTLWITRAQQDAAKCSYRDSDNGTAHARQRRGNTVRLICGDLSGPVRYKSGGAFHMRLACASIAVFVGNILLTLSEQRELGAGQPMREAASAETVFGFVA
jgi:hypothetical protein